MNKYFFGLIISLSFLIFSCQDDDNNTSNGMYSTGTFIINEGTFGAGDGSISFLNEDTLEQNIFSNTNSRLLGDVVQSLTFYDDKGYIVVNNSNKMEVVEGATFAELATVTGLELPRYFIGASNNKGYISQWGSDGVSGSIQILDLNTYNLTGSISTAGGGPEKMELIGDKIYVSHSGGFGIDSMITVIDPFNDNVIQNINTGYNPSDIKQDYNGNVWVLSQGFTDWSTGASVNARLSAFNPSDYSMIHDFELSGNYPSNLKMNEDQTKLYFLFNGAIVEQDVDAGALSLQTIITNNFYGFGINPSNNNFWGCDAKDFASTGEIYIYNNSYTLIDSIPTGIVPRDIVFKN